MTATDELAIGGMRFGRKEFVSNAKMERESWACKCGQNVLIDSYVYFGDEDGEASFTLRTFSNESMPSFTFELNGVSLADLDQAARATKAIGDQVYSLIELEPGKGAE